MRGMVTALGLVALAVVACGGGSGVGPAGTPSAPTGGTASPLPVTESTTPSTASRSPAPSGTPAAPPSATATPGPAATATTTDEVWRRIAEPPPDLPLLDVVSTAAGWLATSSSGDLYSSASGDEWARVDTPFEVTSLARDGDEVLAVGGPAGLVLRHDGQAWQGTQDLSVTFGDFDFGGLGRILVGPAGAIGTTQLVGVVHATDRRAFVESSPPFPFGEGAAQLPEDLEGCGDQQPRFASLPGLLATADGFVALVARRPGQVNLAPVCDPVVYWSVTGATWERIGAEVPLGEAVAVHDVASLETRHVATGERGGRARIWWSDDGRRWEAAATPDQAGRVGAAAAGPSGWVAVAADRDEAAVWRSVDGTTWTVAATQPRDLDQAVADGGVLVAVGRDQLLLQVGTTLWLGSF